MASIGIASAAIIVEIILLAKKKKPADLSKLNIKGLNQVPGLSLAYNF